MTTANSPAHADKSNFEQCDFSKKKVRMRKFTDVWMLPLNIYDAINGEEGLGLLCESPQSRTITVKQKRRYFPSKSGNFL